MSMEQQTDSVRISASTDYADKRWLRTAETVAERVIRFAFFLAVLALTSFALGAIIYRIEVSI